MAEEAEAQRRRADKAERERDELRAVLKRVEAECEAILGLDQRPKGLASILPPIERIRAAIKGED